MNTRNLNPDHLDNRDEIEPVGGALRFVSRSPCNDSCDSQCRKTSHQRQLRILQQYQYSKLAKRWSWYDVPIVIGEDL